MALIDENSIYVPAGCKMEHRAARKVMFLPRGAVDDQGKHSRSVCFSPHAVDDRVYVTTYGMYLTERRARLQAAAWACRWVLANAPLGVPLGDGVDRMNTCIATELSLIPSHAWPQ